MYTSIKVKNYKCFVNDGDYQGFDQIKPVNVIIGKNNSGKSKLLEVLREVIKKNPQELEFNGRFVRTLEQNELSKIFSPSVDVAEVTSSWGHNSTAWNEVGQYLVNQPALYTLQNKTITLNDVYPTQRGHWWKRDAILRLLKRTENENPFKNYQFLHLQAERDIEKEGIRYEMKISDYRIRPNATGICGLIARMLNDEEGNEEHWQEYIEKDFLARINDIVAPEIEFTRIYTKTNQGNTHEIYLEEARKGGIKLSDCGSGLKTIIAALTLLHVVPYLTKSYKNIFAFEELENNMHPSLERKLLAHIRLYSQRYADSFIFLTTHSNVAIDMFGKDYGAQIIRVCNDGHKSTVETVISDNDKQQLLNDLGVKASDLLQSNCLIWVEGPSDRIYIKKWIDLFSDRRLEEGLHYQFIFYGGSLLAHYSVNDKDLIHLLKINRHSYVVMDSDKTSEDAELKARVIRISKELPSSHWITAGKEIENYLPAEVLSNYFEETVSLAKNQIFPNMYMKHKKTKHFDKVAFASNIVNNPQYTKENLSRCLDLEVKVRELIEFIEKSNRFKC